MKGNFPLLAFNRGIVSPLALARVDVERVRLSAETMNNWIPKTQGPMFLRPGTGYIGSSLSDKIAVFLDFVAATDDTALVELTDNALRVWIADVLISYPAVTTTISNSSFATNTSWTDGSTGGGSLTFGGTGLILNAKNRGAQAICTRQITVSAPNQNIEHSLAVHVTRGPVTFRCGSTAGGDQYVDDTTLGTGYHSLAFTPTGDFYLQISSDVQIDRIVASLAIGASGTMTLTAPWSQANLPKLRWTQSADVLFVAAEGYQQHKIERRGSGRSWSVVEYAVDDGPFKSVPTTDARLKPAATFGNTTLTSDKNFFKSTHVGAIFRLFHSGNAGTFYLAREDTWCDPVRVTGIRNLSDGYDDRDFTAVVSGTWVGTMHMQRSFDGADSGYTDFKTIAANGNYDNLNDVDQNSIIYYRVGFKPGDYTSGVAHVAINYDGGGDFGICRVTGYTSRTQVDIEVLKDFKSTEYTDDWREGLWSDKQGWPTAVALYEGRLWWAGNVFINGSVSDAYESFNEETKGDSGPILRSIGAGPVDVVNWLLPLQRLLFGTAGAETSCKSSSFDEPLTPQAFGARDTATQGSGKLPAAKIDKRGVFVQRSLKRVFELVYDGSVLDYAAKELTLLCPDITGGATIVGLAVQRQPDTRIHFWLSDGTVLIVTYEPNENVLCWSTFSTDGTVERVVVLPGAVEDAVYYHINRTISGSTKRYLEKWALESECKGANRNKQLDAFVSLTLSSPVTTVTGLSHLEAKQVAVWAGGKCLADVNGDIALFTVASGQIAIPSTAAAAFIVGLPYTAQYKSSKLAYAAQLGTALNQKKRAVEVGLVLGTAHYKGLKVGRDFSNLDSLPLVKDGKVTSADTVYSEWDQAMTPVPGSWNTDARLYMQASAPRPCEVLAATVQVVTNDKG